MAMERRWKRWVDSSGSPVTAVVRLPISWVNSMAWAFHAPEVSITNCTKMWVDVNNNNNNNIIIIIIIIIIITLGSKDHHYYFYPIILCHRLIIIKNIPVTSEIGLSTSVSRPRNCYVQIQIHKQLDPQSAQFPSIMSIGYVYRLHNKHRWAVGEQRMQPPYLSAILATRVAMYQQCLDHSQQCLYNWFLYHGLYDNSNW